MPKATKPEKVRLTIDLPADLHEKFKAAAETEDLPMAKIGRRLIRGWVEAPAEVFRS